MAGALSGSVRLQAIRHSGVPQVQRLSEQRGQPNIVEHVVNALADDDPSFWFYYSLERLQPERGSQANAKQTLHE